MGCNYDNIICTYMLPEMDSYNPIIKFQSRDLIQDMQQVVIAPDGVMWHQPINYRDGFELEGYSERYKFSGTFRMYGDYRGFTCTVWYEYDMTATDGVITHVEFLEKSKRKTK